MVLTSLFFSLEGQQDNPAAGFVACCRLLLICRNFLSRISLVSSQGEGFPMPGVLLGNGLPGYFPLILLRDTVQGCSCLNCCSHFITRGEEARNPSLKSPHSAFQQEFFKHKFAFLLNFNFFGGIYRICLIVSCGFFPLYCLNLSVFLTQGIQLDSSFTMQGAEAAGELQPSSLVPF